ncbi:hypothetical protein VNO77_03616 [Canavalia gladiata]|uniref:Uncharacterized protein n=1 Tax=Canavalia gladiata TaxID=3824 RepID=A0AAN9R700_CANGL
MEDIWRRCLAHVNRGRLSNVVTAWYVYHAVRDYPHSEHESRIWNSRPIIYSIMSFVLLSKRGRAVRWILSGRKPHGRKLPGTSGATTDFTGAHSDDPRGREFGRYVAVTSPSGLEIARVMSVNHASIPIPLNLAMCISFLNGTEQERIHRGFPFDFERDERRLANLDMNGENSAGSQRSESFPPVPDRASQFAELIPSSAKKKIAPNLRFPSFAVDVADVQMKQSEANLRRRVWAKDGEP